MKALDTYDLCSLTAYSNILFIIHKGFPLLTDFILIAALENCVSFYRLQLSGSKDQIYDLIYAGLKMPIDLYASTVHLYFNQRHT